MDLSKLVKNFYLAPVHLLRRAVFMSGFYLTAKSGDIPDLKTELMEYTKMHMSAVNKTKHMYFVDQVVGVGDSNRSI